MRTGGRCRTGMTTSSSITAVTGLLPDEEPFWTPAHGNTVGKSDVLGELLFLSTASCDSLVIQSQQHSHAFSLVSLRPHLRLLLRVPGPTRLCISLVASSSRLSPDHRLRPVTPLGPCVPCLRILERLIYILCHGQSHCVSQQGCVACSSLV